MSPGRETQRRAKSLDTKREKRRQKAETKEFKLRRKLAKQQRSTAEICNEIREGETYSTNIGKCHQNLLYGKF